MTSAFDLRSFVETAVSVFCSLPSGFLTVLVRLIPSPLYTASRTSVSRRKKMLNPRAGPTHPVKLLPQRCSDVVSLATRTTRAAPLAPQRTRNANWRSSRPVSASSATSRSSSRSKPASPSFASSSPTISASSDSETRLRTALGRGIAPWCAGPIWPKTRTRI